MNEDRNNFDDLIPVSFDDDEVGGSLQGLEEYEKYEVTKKKVEIENKAKKLVESLIKVYFDADLIDQHDHLAAIAQLESDNLIGLIESARYAQHAVSTLMRKIDAGLHADLAVYPILIELQKSALDIQMKVANYSRTLSPYLRSLKEDMEDADNSTIEILSRVETDSIDRGSQNELGNENFRGTLEMNKYFQEKMDAINKNKEDRADRVKDELENKDYTEFENLTDNIINSKSDEEE